MKKVLLYLLLLTLTAASFAQSKPYDRYTVSGGLLGALNLDKFTMKGNNPGNIEYDRTVGWSAGAWLNLPLGRVLSVEPQVMYSLYAYQSVSGNALLLDGNINYISIPVLLKFHFTKGFALTLGPQFDLLGDIDAYPNSLVKGDFASSSMSINGGIEFVPHAPMVVFARYIHGFTNMDNTAEANDEEQYINSNFQFGIKLRLFGKMIPADTDADGIPDRDDKCVTVAGLERYMGCPIPDTDMDGINDEEDQCPNKAGIAKYAGCPIPDTDSDGINDENDKCPKQAGLAKYAGCPIPDTDGDGINDEMDKCPAQAGLAKYNGCPVPDSDKDGINDETDKCPNQAGLAKFGGCPDRDNDGIMDGDDHCPDIVGPVDNFGCPKIESAKFTTQRIQFVTGSANLTADAKADIKEGAKLLNSDDFKMLKIEIRGHTDNTGKAESNQILSEKRAKAVLEELVKNGVARERMTSIGLGQTEPIADNGTAAGRTLNRRVAFDVRQ